LLPQQVPKSSVPAFSKGFESAGILDPLLCGSVMPKMKTNKGAAKRFRFTSKGKVKVSHAFKNHILTKKKMNRKRKLRHADVVHKSDMKEIRDLLPYGR
jgi:large subunit ribosomal protein L35